MNGHTIPSGRLDTRAWVDAVLRFRWPVILLVCALTTVAGSGLRLLDFDADTRIFFAQDNPERRAFETMEKTFKRVNALVFVIAPQDGRVFSRDALQAIEWLTDQAWGIPYTTHVASLTNQFHSRGVGDEIIVEPLITRPSDMSQDEIAAAANAAAARRDLIGLMLSPRLDVTGVMALVNPPGRDHHEVQQMAQHAYAIADELRERFPGIDIYLSGGVMADMAFNEAARRGLTTLLPAMTLVVVLTLMLGLRSFRNTCITLIVVVSALVTTLGLAGWAGLALNTVSAVAPLAILTLALADCVHVTIGMGQQLRAGRALRDAVIETMRIHTLPVIVTSVTTAMGFLTLNFSASPPFRELGNLIAFGVLVALVYVLLLLPALLSLLPDRRAPARLAWEQVALRRLADRVIARRRPLFALGLLTTVILSIGISRISLDDDFIRYFDDSYDFRVGSDFMERRLTGLNVIQYALPSGEEQGIARPDYLETVDAFTAFLREQPGIDHVATMIETLKRLNMNMHGDDPAEYRLPPTRELAAQYLLLYEMALPGGGQGAGLGIDVARSSTLVTATVPGASSADIRRLGALGETWLREHAPRMAAPATGLSIMFAQVSAHNIRSMLTGSALALVLISMALIVVLRSPRLGLISLLPNLMPIVMALGVWGFLYGQVNLAASVVGAMTIGIVVDDTVHLLMRYLRGRRELGLSPADAIRHAFETAGVAVILTSLALSLGFVMMAFSGFAISQQMGLLCMLTIAFALVADLLFLPPLILFVERLRAPHATPVPA